MHARLAWSVLGPLVAVFPMLPASIALGHAVPSLLSAEGAQQRPVPASAERPPLCLDDIVHPLSPSKPRSVAESDHIEAMSLFAAARTRQSRQQPITALRLYQRALRYDPQAVTIIREIVAVAHRLGHYDVAARYAVKLEPKQWADADPSMLRDLAFHLSVASDWEQASVLYEGALEARAGTEQSAGNVLLKLEMGRVFHLLEEYEQAADCFLTIRDAIENPKAFGLSDEFTKALLREPAATYLLFGDTFLRAGRFDEAVASFKKSHEAQPDEAVLQFHLARILVKRSRPREALAQLEACFRQGIAGEGIAPYELFGNVLEKLGKQDELIPRLQALRAGDHSNVPLAYYLAQQYEKGGQYTKARALYLALLEKAPTLDGFRGLLTIYRETEQHLALLGVLGQIVDKTGSLHILAEEIETLVGKDRSDGGPLRTVLGSAKKLYSATPERLDYGMRMAAALLATEADQIDLAGEFFEMAIEAREDRTAEILLTWAVGLLVADRPADAAKLLRRAVEQKTLPTDRGAFHYYFLAGALAMDNQFDKALVAARKASELKEDSPRYHARVGWVLYQAGRHKEATGAYTALMKRFDSNHRSQQTREVLREARLVLSALAVIQNNLSEAEEWLEQVLDEFPDDVGAANDLGYLWADGNKHLHRAIKMVQYAVAADPENIAYRDSLGWVYYRLGRFDEAVAELEAAVKASDEPDAVILEHLADAYHQAERTDDAKRTWRLAIESHERAGEKDKAQAIKNKLSQ